MYNRFFSPYSEKGEDEVKLSVPAYHLNLITIIILQHCSLKEKLFAVSFNWRIKSKASKASAQNVLC